jgi:AcrR family transcriptional regulator
LSITVAKGKNRKTQIIKTAFQVWGDNQFQNTSLSSLSEALGMTKAALYRYFNNKESLLEEMFQYFINEYGISFYQFKQQVTGLNYQQVITKFIHFYFSFYFDHINYFYFFVFHIMPNKLFEHTDLKKIIVDQREMLEKSILRKKDDWNQEKVRIAVNYIFASTSFWFLKHIVSKEQDSLTQERIEKLLKNLNTLVFEGFLDSNVPFKIDFNSIKDQCLISKDELLPIDRIFSSIEEVLSKNGFMGASIEKFATEIGMTKSSLYFFFKDKNDMLIQTINREVEKLFDLLDERIKEFSFFADKICCYIITTANYLLENPNVLNTLDHFKYQKLHHTIVNKSLPCAEPQFLFMKDAIKNNDLNDHNLKIEDIISFLNFQIMRELIEGKNNKTAKNELLNNMEVIHELFMNGIGR